MSAPPVPAGIHLRNLWGTQKLAQLSSEAQREFDFTYNTVSPTPALGVPFMPRRVEADYLTWPRLPEVFPVAFPGVKTSRDSLMVDIDRDRLEMRMKRYFDDSLSDDEIARELPDAMARSAGFNGQQVRAALLPRGFREWHSVPYTYRPFDLRWLYYEPHTNLIDRKREDFLEQLIGETYWLEARQRENGSVFSRGTVTTNLADNFGNGLSTFFPLLAIKPMDVFGSTVQVVANLSESAERYIEGFQGGNLLGPGAVNDLREPTELFFHSLATMHTPRYRTENAGALLGDWPRIPLPATAELLTQSAALGRRLAELLDPESDVQIGPEWNFLARLSIPPEFPENTPDRDRRNAARFAITAGWGGRGQGDTVMPRRGKAPERDWIPSELDRLATLAAAQSLTREDALALLGRRCVDVYLNDSAFWTAVPTNVWEYTLGGYQVLKKWLSYREEPLLGRPLHEDEARYFSQVVRRIAAILLLGPALDASYDAILPTARGF